MLLEILDLINEEINTYQNKINELQNNKRDKNYIEKLDTFVKNYNSNKDDSVRITKFNTKDEPVIIDLTVKKEKESTSVYYDVDYTKTNEKHSENQEIQYSNNTCQKITKDIEDNKVTYKLECPDTIHLITAPQL